MPTTLPRLIPALLAAPLAWASTPGWAQQSAAAANATTVIVTGNPLGRDTLAEPVSSLNADALMQRRAATLGDTLSALPGVAGSGFGPNASRPVIRGLDGDRVRLLDNGGATVDASNLSFDHAVALDPLIVERIELLRGPAALLYGGSATAGVVNALDNRIPRSAQVGLSTRAEWRLGGASAERSAAAVLDGGGGSFAWHADVFGRDGRDQRVPWHDQVDNDGQVRGTDRVRQSAARASGGAFGGAWVDADGHAGLAVDRFDNHYGVTVEPDVSIRMRRDRVQLGAERRRLPGPFDSLSLSASDTRYRHDELEGTGEVGTRFQSRGREWRLQARHKPWGLLQGVIGAQGESLDFSALGEEAFVPATRTRSTAVFVLEEAELGPVRLQAGARRERVRVASAGDAATDAEGRFGAAAVRRFEPASASLGATWRIDAQWALGGSVSHTERAPAYYELFANGLHVATGAWEQGDPTLGVERSRHLGLTLEWRGGPHSAKLNLWHSRFSRFIALSATGVDRSNDDGESAPEYRFEAVRARLHGMELESRWRLADRPWRLDLTAQLDAVRGTDVDHAEPLPRLAPMRAALGLEWTGDMHALGLELRHASRQSRVPALDTPTPGYTLWSAFARWRLPMAGDAATVFVKLDNLGNQLAYNASSVATIRALSPLPGRSISVGLRWQG